MDNELNKTGHNNDTANDATEAAPEVTDLTEVSTEGAEAALDLTEVAADTAVAAEATAETAAENAPEAVSSDLKNTTESTNDKAETATADKNTDKYRFDILSKLIITSAIKIPCDFISFITKSCIIFLCIIWAAIVIVKTIIDAKRSISYNSMAKQLHLTVLPAMMEIQSLYGQEIAKQFHQGERTIIARYGGLFVSYAQGEFFRLRSVEKKIEMVTGRNGTRPREVEYQYDYDCVIFSLGREALPHFNLDSTILRDLYMDLGAAQQGVYAKYFDNKTLGFVVKYLPGVSICSAGNALLFYKEDGSVKDMQNYIQAASKVAEHILGA